MRESACFRIPIRQVTHNSNRLVAKPYSLWHECLFAFRADQFPALFPSLGINFRSSPAFDQVQAESTGRIVLKLKRFRAKTVPVHFRAIERSQVFKNGFEPLLILRERFAVGRRKINDPERLERGTCWFSAI